MFDPVLAPAAPLLGGVEEPVPEPPQAAAVRNSIAARATANERDSFGRSRHARALRASLEPGPNGSTTTPGRSAPPAISKSLRGATNHCGNRSSENISRVHFALAPSYCAWLHPWVAMPWIGIQGPVFQLATKVSTDGGGSGWYPRPTMVGGVRILTGVEFLGSNSLDRLGTRAAHLVHNRDVIVPWCRTVAQRA